MRWTGTAVFACVLATHTFGASPEQEMRDLVAEQRQKEAWVCSKLKDEDLWSNKKREAELLATLDAAAAIRPLQAIPILVPHIAYTPVPPEQQVGSPRPTDMIYPAYRALLSLGDNAVPALLMQARRSNPDDLKHGGAHTWGLSVHCVTEIYGRGGDGLELARRRVELELSVTPEGERAPLERALGLLALATSRSTSRPTSRPAG